MAMEDAYVLAEVLRRAETVEDAMVSFEARRNVRATWVQQQSLSILESYLMPPAERELYFRERGKQDLYESFEPLLSEP